MCDYSLMAFPNRLAVCGENLVVHRFEAGSVGLASPEEVCKIKEARAARPDTFWARLKTFLNPPSNQHCTAVCIPPGARLMVRDIPERLQHELSLKSDAQEVVFTQTNTVGFRDAIRFENGAEILLQRLSEGQRIHVLALSHEEHEDLELVRWGRLSKV